MKTTAIISGNVGRPRRKHLTLWTMQPVQVWHDLIRDKSLHVSARWIEPEFIQSYDWMVAQMKIRIEDCAGNYPWWAYEHRPKIGYHFHQPGLYVTLRLNLDPARVLLSSYGSWHDVLNDRFFVHPADFDESDEEPTGTQPEKERSWEGIFDVETLRPYDTIQATFETLRLEDVVRYTLFEVTEE